MLRMSTNTYCSIWSSAPVDDEAKKSARRSGGETIHKCGYEAPIGATA